MKTKQASCWHCQLQAIDIPTVPAGCYLCCPRCDARLDPWVHRIRDNGWSLVCAIGALVFYPLGMLLPMMSIEQLGHRHESNLIEAVTTLLSHGQLIIALVILACSVLLPMSKLIGMFILLFPAIRDRITRHRRAQLLHLIELTGRFGFLDIVLVAILVAVLKVGDLVQVTVGPGLLAFTLLVVFSLLSSLLFDAKSLWRNEPV